MLCSRIVRSPRSASALLLSLSVVFGAAGCVPPDHVGHPGEAREAASEEGHGGHATPPRARGPVDPELFATARRVRVLPNANVGCVSEVLGLVDVHEGAQTQEQALDELRLDAARLGADAVIGVEFEHADGKATTHLPGMAVRCRDLLRGRAYDVISVIEVPGEMGKEDAAFAALRARGRELRADLLIDTKFAHGEGTSKTLLRATAIRIRGGKTASAP